jgi:hypothetical protein
MPDFPALAWGQPPTIIPSRPHSGNGTFVLYGQPSRMGLASSLRQAANSATCWR